MVVQCLLYPGCSTEHAYLRVNYYKKKNMEHTCAKKELKDVLFSAQLLLYDMKAAVRGSCSMYSLVQQQAIQTSLRTCRSQFKTPVFFSQNLKLSTGHKPVNTLGLRVTSRYQPLFSTLKLNDQNLQSAKQQTVPCFAPVASARVVTYFMSLNIFKAMTAALQGVSDNSSLHTETAYASATPLYPNFECAIDKLVMIGTACFTMHGLAVPAQGLYCGLKRLKNGWQSTDHTASMAGTSPKLQAEPGLRWVG
jgi:hypothetical protein